MDQARFFCVTAPGPADGHAVTAVVACQRTAAWETRGCRRYGMRMPDRLDAMQPIATRRNSVGTSAAAPAGPAPGLLSLGWPSSYRGAKGICTQAHACSGPDFTLCWKQGFSRQPALLLLQDCYGCFTKACCQAMVASRIIDYEESLESLIFVTSLPWMCGPILAR